MWPEDTGTIRLRRPASPGYPAPGRTIEGAPSHLKSDDGASAPVEGAPVYCDGVAFRKGNTELRDAFDVELAKLKESGEFAKIIEPYGFSAQAALSTDRDTLCAQE